MHAIRTRLSLVIATIMMMIAASPIFAVGTVNQAISPIGRDPGSNPDNRVHQLAINWMADASVGTVPVTTLNLGSFPAIQGMRLVSVEIKPGTPAPTNLYSITITDAAGVDLLGGTGASLSNTVATSTTITNLPAPVFGSLTFTLTGNSVNSATGTVFAYFAPLTQTTITTGSPTLTGANTFTGTNTFTGATNVTTLNNVQYCDQFAGATADVKITNCIAALPAAGGVADARGFGATTQTIAATVTVGTATKPVTLLCNPATTYAPSASGVDMFAVGANGWIDGLTVNATSLGNYAGNAVKLVDNNLDGQRLRLTNFILFNGTTLAGITTGNGVLLQSVNNVNHVAFAEIGPGKIVGFNNGIFLNAGGTPGSIYFVSGNTFHDIEIKNAVSQIQLTDNTGDLRGNLFVNINLESGPQTVTGINASGAILGNMFFNVNIWDMPAATFDYQFSATSTRNFFFGNLYSAGSTATDAGTNNNFWIPSNNAFGNVWNWNLNSDLQLTFSALGHGIILKNADTQWNIQPHINAAGDLCWILGGVGVENCMTSTEIYPNTAGGQNLGKAANPFGKIFLGTAATNNFVFTPSSTTAARTVTLPDPGVNVNLPYSVNALTFDGVYGTYRVTTDQTITAGASLTNIPGLTWTFPANTALNVKFTCDLLYSQATAAASDSFGFQDVTVAPTNAEAYSRADTSATAFTAGNTDAAGVTTAVTVVTYTPSAATTVFGAHIDGLIEQPSNASTSAFNIMAQFTTNNGTIKRGSSCQVF